MKIVNFLQNVEKSYTTLRMYLTLSKYAISMCNTQMSILKNQKKGNLTYVYINIKEFSTTLGGTSSSF